MRADPRGYELYEFLTRQIVGAIAVHFGEERPEAANAVADAVCVELISEWGGMQFYLPKATLAKCSAEAETIWAEFKGSNYAELAKKFGKTEMRIRQIIRAMRIKSNSRGKPKEA